MKTVIINTRAWHYKLASLFNDKDRYREPPQDICSYVHQIVGVVIGLSVLCCFGLAGCYVAGEILAWIAACIFSGSFIPEWPAIFIFVGGLVFGVWFIVKGTTKAAEHSPKFLKDAYISFRDKVCYRVDYR